MPKPRTISLLLMLGLAACSPEPDRRPGNLLYGSAAYLAFFGWDSAEISKQTMGILDRVARQYHGWSGRVVECEGHTDTSGSDDYNVALSIRRVNAVKAALVEKSVPPEAISCRGEGKAHPLISTPDGVREPQNRYVGIRVKEADGSVVRTSPIM